MKIKQKWLVNKSDIAGFIATLATKAELKAEQDEKQKYKHLIQSIFVVNQNCLVFQKPYRYFKMVSNTNNHILSWKSKGLSDENIKPPSTSTNILNPLLNYVDTNIRVEFKKSCLKQDKISFDHGKVANIYIVYEINRNVEIGGYPTLQIVFVQLN